MKNIDQIVIFTAVALGVLALTGGLAQAQEPAPAAAPPAPVAVSTRQAADVGQPTVTTFTNGPVPDTAENRGKYGPPLSQAGKKTRPKGN